MDAKTLCLGALILGDASGYEIKKLVEQGPFAHFHATGFGSIYPALSALLAERLVTCTACVQEGRPDKKVYAITEAGRRALRRALHKAPGPDAYRSEAVFMMFFGDLLDPDHRETVFDDYLATYREHVARMTAQDRSSFAPGRRFVHGLGLAIYRTVVDYMEQHRSLLLGDDVDEQHSRPTAATAAVPPAGAE